MSDDHADQAEPRAPFSQTVNPHPATKPGSQKDRRAVRELGYLEDLDSVYGVDTETPAGSEARRGGKDWLNMGLLSAGRSKGGTADSAARVSGASRRSAGPVRLLLLANLAFGSSAFGFLWCAHGQVAPGQAQPVQSAPAQAPVPEAQPAQIAPAQDDLPLAYRQSVALRYAEKQLYSDAQPYVEDPVEELRTKVPELKALKSDTDQDKLSDLLAKVGAKVDELAKKVPDLTSDEQVTQVQGTGLEQNCAVDAHCPGSLRIHKSYHYILLSHQTPEGSFFEESRTNQENQEIESQAGPNSIGFAGTWLIFSPVNNTESHFRYIGEEKIGKRKSYVVAFAEIPGMVRVPGIMMDTQGRMLPSLLQGFAWIDEEDFRILQLRTDLLEPQLEIGLQKQTAIIVFGPVAIAQLNLRLWLPMEVDVNVEHDGLYSQELHTYSNFRMYHATSRIIP